MILSCALSIAALMASNPEPQSAWQDTYVVTAQDICDASESVEEAADLIAIGWLESRYSPYVRDGIWQTSPWWGPHTAATAIKVIRMSRKMCGDLSWYTHGGNGCRPNRWSRHREWLAKQVLGNPGR